MRPIIRIMAVTWRAFLPYFWVGKLHHRMTHVRAASPFVKRKSGRNRLLDNLFAAHCPRFTTGKGCSLS